MARPDTSGPMPFEIRVTNDARRHLASLSARDRNTLRAAIDATLRHQPTVPTRAVKRLRPNQTAAYELRVGDLRVLYDVEEVAVEIRAVGLKVGNTLVVEGEVFDGLQDDKPQPTGDEPAADAG